MNIVPFAVGVLLPLWPQLQFSSFILDKKSHTSRHCDAHSAVIFAKAVYVCPELTFVLVSFLHCSRDPG